MSSYFAQQTVVLSIRYKIFLLLVFINRQNALNNPFSVFSISLNSLLSYIYQSIYPFIYLSIYLSLRSIYISRLVSIYLSIYVPVYLFQFLSIYLSRNLSIYIYIYHHHVLPPKLISLTLSRHFSLSFIASGRSSGLQLVSSHSCCMYVLNGHPALAPPYVGVHRSTSLMSSSLLLQQCPACLVRLT